MYCFTLQLPVRIRSLRQFLTAEKHRISTRFRQDGKGSLEAFVLSARELFDSPLSAFFLSPWRGAQKEGRKRRNRRRRRTCLLGARWRKRWCESIRGMRSSSTTRSYNSSSSTWRRGLLAVKAHPAVTGRKTRRSYCTARPLHSRRVSSVRESMQHWRLSTPPPSRAATRRDTLRRSQHR